MVDLGDIHWDSRGGTYTFEDSVFDAIRLEDLDNTMINIVRGRLVITNPLTARSLSLQIDEFPRVLQVFRELTNGNQKQLYVVRQFAMRAGNKIDASFESCAKAFIEKVREYSKWVNGDDFYLITEEDQSEWCVFIDGRMSMDYVLKGIKTTEFICRCKNYMDGMESAIKEVKVEKIASGEIKEDVKPPKIYTSYYAKMGRDITRNGLIPVRVSNSVPDWFPIICEELPQVYPGWQLSSGLRYGKITETEFSDLYTKKLLGTNKQSVLNRLYEISEQNGNRDLVLLCYEANNKFCHRHILAKWLGPEVKEIGGYAE